MVSISQNKYDIQAWIIKVIDSCQTRKHCRTADKLIDAFLIMYGDWRLTGQLRALVYIQKDEIINKS
jgi:hypothetical protein